MIDKFIKQLNEDNSNIDEVYDTLLKEYNPDNVDSTEVTFVDHFEYDNISSDNSQKGSAISYYLGRKRNKVEWFDLDYLNHYVKHKRFGFQNIKTFKENEDKEEYSNTHDRLYELKRLFFYIYKRLEGGKREEFIDDSIGQLKKAINKQTIHKYIRIIQSTIDGIEKELEMDKFISKYKFDFWFSYKNECKSIPSNEGKIQYWNLLKKEYKKERLEFDSLDFARVTFNMELMKPKDIFGISFVGFCEKEIKSIKIDIEHDTLVVKKPQQSENTKTDTYEVKKKLHNRIFKGNTFKVWEIYRINKNITASSKTDLTVVFQLMMEDNYFQDTIELKHFIVWINKEYFDGVITEIKKLSLDSRPNIQRKNDYTQYKNNLKITLE